MSPEQKFQHRHGPRWAAIAQGAELTDALLTVNASLLDEIRSLTPEQINQNGNVILAKLQGQLLHEAALLDLAIVHPSGGNDLTSDYPDPQDELEQQADEQDVMTGGPFQEWMTAEPPLPDLTAAEPPKKRRGRKPKTK